MKWRMADRKVVDVKDMDTQHIFNCIAMLDRQLEDLEAYAEIDDMPDDMCMGWPTLYDYEKVKKQIRGLKRELSRRGHKGKSPDQAYFDELNKDTRY